MAETKEQKTTYPQTTAQVSSDALSIQVPVAATVSGSAGTTAQDALTVSGSEATESAVSAPSQSSSSGNWSSNWSEGEISANGQIIDPSGIVIPGWITVNLIHINEISRPCIALDAVNDIAIHYVANPGSTAMANRDYFDSLDNPNVEGAGRKASAHLIVGLEGEVVQCLPLNEVAYAVHSRNYDTISIEVCHPDSTGKFSNMTYETLVKLTAWLLQQTGLTPDHVIRHYDCDGKNCPLYYVENENAWEQLKQDISDYYYANPDIE